MIQTYSHQNLQNTGLSAYLPLFHGAGVRHIANASPLNMGMLTTRGMPVWHPAMREKGLVDVTEEVKRKVGREGARMEDVAVMFGMRELRDGQGGRWRCPVVVGCSDLEQVGLAVGDCGILHRMGGVGGDSLPVSLSLPLPPCLSLHRHIATRPTLTPSQVHQAVSSYLTATTTSAATALPSLEQLVQSEYKSSGWFNYSWHSGA
jgi:hypothetical protein